jgi:uncharacterized protein YbcI
MATTREDRHDGATRSAISKMLVRVHVDHAGRGPTMARTYLDEDIVTTVLEDSLTPVEKTLADDGQTDTIERVRHKLQQTMRDDMVRHVEGITGRTVRAFLSANELEPDVAVETFLLEPPDRAVERPDPGGQVQSFTPRSSRGLEPEANRPAPRPAF